MFSTLDGTKNNQQISWEQRLLKNSNRQNKASLKPEYQELKFTLHRKLVDKINLEALATIDNQRVRSEVRQAVIALIDAEPTLLSSLEKQQISDEVLDEVFGLGPLEPLLQDPGISDILVNTHKQVYIEKRGLLELTNVTFRDDSHLLRIIDKIVSQVGRRIDESTPMVDARLSDGSRVNAIIPPLAVDGPLLSIRRFSTDKLMPADLVERKALTPGMMELLEACVKAKLNIIIAGGTGAGKTTLLNALSAFINGKERIVTIEDAAELQLKQPHVARLETRPPNIEGNGAVRQRELLVNSLRMRPDRIVVGEVRGEEALDMLQAMNTGHDGSLGERAGAGIASLGRISPRRVAYGSDRHGRRNRHFAGFVRVRKARSRSGRQSRRTLRRDRYSPQVLRKAFERRHPLAARSVRRSGGGLNGIHRNCRPGLGRRDGGVVCRLQILQVLGPRPHQESPERHDEEQGEKREGRSRKDVRHSRRGYRKEPAGADAGRQVQAGSEDWNLPGTGRLELAARSIGPSHLDQLRRRICGGLDLHSVRPYRRVSHRADGCRNPSLLRMDQAPRPSQEI
jgi:pilus assembly protein CpaF